MASRYLIIFNFLFIVFIQSCENSQAANILGLFNAPSRSHHMIHMTIVNELVARGHNVSKMRRLNINSALLYVLCLVGNGAQRHAID